LGIFNDFNRKIWPKGLFSTTAWMQLVRATQEQLPSRFSVLGQAPSATLWFHSKFKKYPLNHGWS